MDNAAASSAAAVNTPATSGASLWLDLLYLSAGLLLIPYFLYRRLIKRKQSAPWKSKLGFVAPRREGPRVWIHAVSVGEATAAETLVKALKKSLPQLDVVVSTTTVTGQSVAAKRYGEQNVFYYPLDLSCCVRRVLDRIRPTLLVLMELEVWPNMTAEAVARGIPVLVANGRITERSARRYGRFWFLVGKSFQRVRHWLVQSEEYATRLKQLGLSPERISIGGNMKYDAIDTTTASETARIQTRAAIGIAPEATVLIGGSTHPSEEAELLKGYVQLRSSVPNLRLVLVPRHPERIQAVLLEVASAGFAALRRSQAKEKGLEACLAQLPSAQRESAVVIIDTIGELKAMYAAADVAFVGGSLIPHGGQNVMEPCGLGVPVLHGPHMHNFNDAMALLKACQGSIEVSRQSLPVKIEKLLNHRAEAKAMAARARETFLKQQGATQRAVDYINNLLQGPRVG